MSDLVPGAGPRRVPLDPAALRRRRHDRLARLVPLLGGAGEEAGVAGAIAAVLALAGALASEEWRAAAGDWSFRPARLRALRHALARARADLRRRRRAAGRDAGT